MKKEPETKG